jgi:hypothetical protein
VELEADLKRLINFSQGVLIWVFLAKALSIKRIWKYSLGEDPDLSIYVFGTRF